ncbi:metallophosphoesterase [Balneolaceae bacterium ANBcel3]|nr:metallophosphoesterase [Balneolaceae bacterium ANBcel3]
MDSLLSFLIFFTILYTVFGGMQWYVVRTGFRSLPEVYPPDTVRFIRRITLSLLLLFNLLFILRFNATEIGWYDHPLFQVLVVYPGGLFFGVVVFSFFVLLPVRVAYRVFSAILAIGRFIKRISKQVVTWFSDTSAIQNTSSVSPVSCESSPQSLITRRTFLKTAGISLAAVPSGITILASAATAHDYQIVRKKLHFPNLPSGLNGLRIVQISDIHSGIYMTEQQMRDIFELSNQQHPDLVIITGDFVDNSVSEIPALHRALGDLKAEYGIYGCLGNHDHYASSRAVADSLLDRSLGLLTNQHQTLSINGENLTLYGIDDAVTRETDEQKVLASLQGADPDGFGILMSHRPDVFDTVLSLPDHNIGLTLAGHTHGGQIGFNFLGVPVYPIHLFQKYAKGLYTEGPQKLYVNVGIGMVGAPVRTVRPELTVLELTHSAT